jgi:hypothetical protein
MRLTRLNGPPNTRLIRPLPSSTLTIKRLKQIKEVSRLRKVTLINLRSHLATFA